MKTVQAILIWSSIGALAACSSKSSEPLNLSGLPSVQEACDSEDVSDVTASEDHNVEIVDVTELDKLGEVTCNSDVSETVGRSGGYVAARVVDELTGRRALSVRVGPDSPETVWIDDPNVFPAMANGWHSEASTSGSELFLFGALTAVDPTIVDPVMDGRVALFDASGSLMSELIFPKDPSSFIHDVCKPTEAGERFHVIGSAGKNPFATPDSALESPEDIASAQINAKGCVTYTYRDAGGWAINESLGNACACEQLPGEVCEDSCFATCVFGQDGVHITSDPVCGPNEECTGAAGVNDPEALIANLGIDSTLEIGKANCVPKAELPPVQCESDYDCSFESVGTTYCVSGQCHDCRSDGDCSVGACENGVCTQL